MNIQILSDLHLEFGSTEWCFPQADVVVLAGDVHLGVKGIAWILETIPHTPVIYVLGNHEYYKGAYPKTLHQIKAAADGSHVHVLENEAVVLDGIVFHGATLWTDFALLGESRTYGIICQSQMNDYKQIRRTPSYSKLRSIDVYQIHQASVRWLRNSLEQHAGKTNVVVTHHAPSPKSIPEAFRDSDLSAAYASNLEAIMEAYAPQLWIHGHVHTPVQYRVGHTQVICNPYGYINEPYNGFERELVVRVP